MVNTVTDLMDLCNILESCKNKHDLAAALNISTDKFQLGAFFVESLRKFDDLFVQYHFVKDVSVVRNTVIQDSIKVVEDEFNPFMFGGVERVVVGEIPVKNTYRTTLLLRDELYLRGINAINTVYQNELHQDKSAHPSCFFHKTKSQEYVERSDQIYYSKMLSEIITKNKGVIQNTQSCDVNPSDLFASIFEKSFKSNVLNEIASRVMSVFKKKLPGELSISSVWNVQQGEYCQPLRVMRL